MTNVQRIVIFVGLADASQKLSDALSTYGYLGRPQTLGELWGEIAGKLLISFMFTSGAYLLAGWRKRVQAADGSLKENVVLSEANVAMAVCKLCTCLKKWLGLAGDAKPKEDAVSKPVK